MRTENNRARSADFARGSIPRLVMSIALPMIAAQMVNVLYNLVDRIYIGHIPRVGSAALTGVGVALPVITVLSAFAGLFGQGGTPLFSIARGQGNQQEAGRIQGNAMTMLLVSSAALAILARIVSRPVLMALGAGEATIGYAEEYFHTYLLGTPCVFITLGMNGYINAQGFPRWGMMTVMLGAAANIVLDPVFIFLLRMNVRGAALATVISQAVSAGWCLTFLLGKRAVLPLRPEHMRLRLRTVKRIIAMGTSSFIAQSTSSAVAGIANRQLFLFGGDVYVAAMTVVNSMRIMMLEILHGMAAGVQPVLGFNYGAGQKRRVLQGIRFTSAVYLGLNLFFMVIFELFPEFFVRIFTGDEALIAVAVPALRIYYCGTVFLAMQSIGFTVYQGLGMARRAVFFSMLRKIIIVVPLMLLLPRLWGLGADGVFWSEPVSDLLGGGASYITMLLTVYFPLRRELREEEKCKS